MEAQKSINNKINCNDLDNKMKMSVLVHVNVMLFNHQKSRNSYLSDENETFNYVTFM